MKKVHNLKTMKIFGKATIGFLSLSFLLTSCGMKNEKTSFKEIKKDVVQFNHKMQLSNSHVEYTHVASVEPSLVDGHILQATGMDQNSNRVYISYNTQGEPVRGGLDIVELNSLGQPNLKASFVSNEAEYAEIKFKNNHVYLVGQKKGSERNYAVLTVVDVQNALSPVVSSELVFEDGRYATSIDLEGNKAYVTIPKIGLKIVDISNPSSIVLEKTEFLNSEESEVVSVPSNSQTPSLPEGFTMVTKVSNEWSDTWNNRYGHKYQILFKHNFPNNVNGTPYYNSWSLCFNSEFAIATEGVPWNAVIQNLGNGNYKVTPKTQNDANLWSNTNADIGWNSVLSSPLNGRRISNIKLSVGGVDCAAGETKIIPQFNNSLFVRRYQGKSVVIGGNLSTKVIFNENSQNSLVSDISSLVSEAPSRFVIKNHVLYTNAGATGLSIIDNLNSSPERKSHIPLSGTGNGITIDNCGQAYLAQGEDGVIVADVRNISAPLSLGSFDYADDFGSANNVFQSKIANTNHIIVSDGRGGVKVIKAVMPYGCN